MNAIATRTVRHLARQTRRVQQWPPAIAPLVAFGVALAIAVVSWLCFVFVAGAAQAPRAAATPLAVVQAPPALARIDIGTAASFDPAVDVEDTSADVP